MSVFFLTLFVVGILIILFKKPQSAFENRKYDSIEPENEFEVDDRKQTSQQKSSVQQFGNTVSDENDVSPIETSSAATISTLLARISKHAETKTSIDAELANSKAVTEETTKPLNSESLSTLIGNLIKHANQENEIHSVLEERNRPSKAEKTFESSKESSLSMETTPMHFNEEKDLKVALEIGSYITDDSVIDISNEGADIKFIENSVDSQEPEITDGTEVKGASIEPSYSNIDTDYVDQYAGFTTPDYSNRDYFFEYSLSRKLSKQLTLTKDQSKWLDEVLYHDTVFLRINGCMLATAKNYLTIVGKINDKYTEDGTSFHVILKEFAKKIAKVEYSRYPGYNFTSQVMNNLYLNIFKKSEQTIRDHYRHKRSVNTVFYYPEFEEEYRNLYGDLVDELLKLCTIDEPDEITQIELNKYNTTRWRFEFDRVEKELKDKELSIPLSVKEIKTLAKLNKKNPNLEHIYFEASKMLSRYDREEAVKMYLYYIHTDLKSKTIDNKQLTKTVQKSLFRNADELDAFEAIALDLINHRDIRKAIRSVKTVYMPKRKKIEIDRTQIKEVKKKDLGTVTLLNEILEEQETQEYSAVHLEVKNEEELTLKITSSNDVSNGRFNEVQRELIKKFVENEFILEQEIVSQFAQEKGLFKNQLIDQINELVYDELDDVLIEEEEDTYIILPQSFKTINYEN